MSSVWTVAALLAIVAFAIVFAVAAYRDTSIGRARRRLDNESYCAELQLEQLGREARRRMREVADEIRLREQRPHL